MTNFPAFSDHIIALLLGLVMPVVSGLQSAKAFKTLRLDEAQRKRFFISNSFFLWILAFVVFINWILHGRSFDKLGITTLPHFNAFIIILTATFIFLYIADSLLTLRTEHDIAKAREHWKKTAPFMPVRYRELRAYLFLCMSAGICEEVLFRGFLVPYVHTFFIDNPYGETYAVVIPAMVFAAGHYYQGLHAVLKTVVLSALFGFIFLYSRSLWIVIILHFAIDFAGGLLSIRYLTDNGHETKEEGKEKELMEDSNKDENVESRADKNEKPE